MATYRISEQLYAENDVLLLLLVHGSKKEFRDRATTDVEKAIIDCFESKPNKANLFKMFSQEVITLLWFEPSSGSTSFRDSKKLKTHLNKLEEAQLETVSAFLVKHTK